MQQIKISQSLLKGLYEYKAGKECGLVFEKKYLEHRYDLFPATDSMKLGIWFEYMVSGNKPKSGGIPQAEYYLKGENKGKLKIDYETLNTHVANFKKLREYYDFEILSAGVVWDTESGLSANLDLLCKANKNILNEQGDMVVNSGDRFIADIKVSGLLDDKWSDFGWDFDNLNNKEKLIIQPIHYKYLSREIEGKELPFIFILFNPKNENDFRMIEFKCSEQTLEAHKIYIIKSVEWLHYYIKKGFEARPNTVKCAKCPLREDCEFKIDVPKIKTFYYGN